MDSDLQSPNMGRLLALACFTILLSWGAPCHSHTPRCGTIAAYYQDYSGDFSAPAARSSLLFSRISPSGRFEVHYALSGVDSTTEEFVDSALVILDAVWDFEVDTLGYRAPPFESDGRIHVYLENLARYYGSTHAHSSSGTNVTSHIRCENDFAEPIFTTHGVEALKVTLAHEFFHVIQFGYRLDPSQLGIYEWFATWMEDIAYDEINDYLPYTDVLFENPETSLFRVNGSYEYAACIFTHLLSQGYGNETILEIWERFGEQGGDIFTHILNIMGERDVDPVDLAAEYMVWCYHTGDRAEDGFGFHDAGLYRELSISVFPTWASQLTQSLGTWGFFCADLPGGIHGDPGLEVIPGQSVAGVVAVGNGAGVQYLSSGEIGNLYGTHGFAGALALDENGMQATLHVRPERDSELEILAVYPNPSTGPVSCEIYSGSRSDVSLEIINLLGRRVWRERRNLTGESYLQFLWNGNSSEGQSASSGWYILRVKAGDKVICQPFIRLGAVKEGN